MKRIIRASRQLVIAAEDITDRYFSDFAGRAYNIGYDFDVDSDMNIKMTAREDADKMPKIDIATEKTTDGTYLFFPMMTFPILDSNELEFADSLEYYTKKWNRVAMFLTSLINFEFNPANYEDDEE